MGLSDRDYMKSPLWLARSRNGGIDPVGRAPRAAAPSSARRAPSPIRHRNRRARTVLLLGAVAAATFVGGYAAGVAGSGPLPTSTA